MVLCDVSRWSFVVVVVTVVLDVVQTGQPGLVTVKHSLPGTLVDL